MLQVVHRRQRSITKRNNPKQQLDQSQGPASIRYRVHFCRYFTVFLADTTVNLRLRAFYYRKGCTALKKEAFVRAMLPIASLSWGKKPIFFFSGPFSLLI